MQEWVAISFSRGSSRSRNWTCVLYLLHGQVDSLPLVPPGKPRGYMVDRNACLATVVNPEESVGCWGTQEVKKSHLSRVNSAWCYIGNTSLRFLGYRFSFFIDEETWFRHFKGLAQALNKACIILSTTTWNFSRFNLWEEGENFTFPPFTESR